jgi:flagellar protein FliO/FliZ
VISANNRSNHGKTAHRATMWCALTAVFPGFAMAATPSVAPEPMAAGHLLQLIFGMIVVIGAILATGYILRRVGRLSSSIPGALRIIGGLSVGARERVVLVQVGDQQLLLGVAPGRVQALHVLARPLVADADAPGGENFAERLSKLMKRGPQG